MRQRGEEEAREGRKGSGREGGDWAGRCQGGKEGVRERREGKEGAMDEMKGPGREGKEMKGPGREERSQGVRKGPEEEGRGRGS